ncbi:MAG: sulfotransferase [Acidobacteria bacterium]|nr:sulfotransferase [Acidobacteriota bacterium]
MTRGAALEAGVLDRRRILETASRLAGTDVSATPHVAALDAFVTSLRDDARLHAAGERRIAAELVRCAVAGWRFVRPHDGEADRASSTASPILVTGLPRSGTTLLQHLIACNPEVRAVRRWEMLRAATPPEDAAGRARQIAAVQQEIDAVYARLPALRSAHSMAATDPDECSLLLGHTFSAPSWFTRYHVPSYFEWQMHADLTPAYRQLARTLQAITGGDARPLLLKDPSHFWHLETVLAVWPDVRVLRLRRAMPDTIASYARLCHLLRSGDSDAVDPLAVGPECVRMAGAALRRASTAAVRFAPGHLIDVDYDDLVADPIGVLRRLHATLALPWAASAEQAARAWLSRHPTPAYRPASLAACGLSDADIATIAGG